MVDSQALFAMARAAMKSVVPAGSMVGGQQGFKVDAEISAAVPIFGLGSTDGSTTTAPFAKPFRMDAYGGNVISAMYEHYINKGNHFFFTDYDTDVDIVAPKYWRFTTPASTKRAHIVFEVTVSGSALIQLYENPTITVAGTGLTLRNSDRNSATASTMLAYYDPTVTVDNVLLFSRLASGAGTVFVPSYEAGQSRKLILLANEDYVIKVTAVADNTEVGINCAFVEIDA